MDDAFLFYSVTLQIFVCRMDAKMVSLWKIHKMAFDSAMSRSFSMASHTASFAKQFFLQAKTDPPLWGLRVELIGQIWQFVADDLLNFANAHGIDDHHCHVCYMPGCCGRHFGLDTCSRTWKTQVFIFGGVWGVGGSVFNRKAMSMSYPRIRFGLRRGPRNVFDHYWHFSVN